MNQCLKCKKFIKNEWFSCVHGCTFCKACTELMKSVCPNCNGALCKRNSNKKALFIIDVQEAFNDPSWGERNNLDAEANINKILKTWRANGQMVVMITHVSENPTSLFYKGSSSQQLKSSLHQDPHDFHIEKQVNSSFVHTDLEKMLKEHGVTTVVVTGLTTPHCVSTTVRMSANLGFDTYVVEDATAAFELTGHNNRYYDASTVHELSLVTLEGEFAKVMTTEMVVKEIFV
ncbi:isochorismatase family protein [Shouchella sp. JSM 1781072]|uniref:isochorismatase family protein n=1 Tax=Shouchella sp. JSM 1781072 TaxID=3344581 RepID=UPI0035C19B3F